MRASTAGPHVNSMEHLRNVELDCAGNAGELLETRRQRLSAGEEKTRAWRCGHFCTTFSAETRSPPFDEESCAQVLGTLRNTIQVPTLRG